MKLALDENLPPSLAGAVDALLGPYHGQAISIPQRFGAGVADLAWIAALRDQGGWAVLTVDRKLRTRPHEREALGQSGLIVFVLAHGWNQEPYWPKAAGVVRWLPSMIEAASDVTPPALMEIPHRWTPRPLRAWHR